MLCFDDEHPEKLKGTYLYARHACLINAVSGAVLLEKAADEKAEPLMPLSESDVRTVAPSDVTESVKGRSDQGRDLTPILLAVFLFLMLAEMGVSRYVG